jgi:hypothetical protein
MIPALIDLDPPCPWAVLPPGIHRATLDEVRQAFATTPHRTALFEGLQRAIAALEAAGCKTLYLDGSFVSAKPHPGDFDGCWEVAGVDPARLDPVLLDFNGAREAQKAKYCGELFFIGMPGMFDFLKFFQIEKFSGRPKGILRVELSPQAGPNV